MDFESLRNCSSTELRTVKKQISTLLKRKRSRPRTRESETQTRPSSRASSRGSRRSRRSQKSVSLADEAELIKEKSSSRSLINLKEDSSGGSTCVENIDRQYRQTYKGPHTSYERVHGKYETGYSDGDEDDEKSLSQNSISEVSVSKSEVSQAKAKQFERLSNTVQKLHSLMDEFQPQSSSRVSLRQKFVLDKKKIPKISDKDSITTLTKIVNSLANKLEQQVSQLLNDKRRDRLRLQEFRNDNTLLKQRLTNSLTLQRNLEGELAELSKEKKLLEAENKNLAIKIVPLLTENLTNRTNNEITAQTSRQQESRPFPRRYSVDIDNNVKSRIKSFKSGRQSYPALIRPSRSVSLGSITQNYTFDEEEEESTLLRASNSVSDSNIPSDSGSDVASIIRPRRRNGTKRERDELDSIASYVRWKNLDFNRLHGKLHKNFEELQNLRQKLSLMNQEKSEILGDLEELVNSYRDLEKERDNYESILKMILKEKNSPESNIRGLVDSLLAHLNATSSGNYPSTTSSSTNLGGQPHPSRAPEQSSNSRSFLEGALNMIQEQNISVREELTRVKESLQSTTGQNTLLLSHNQTLLEKVNEFQRQIESKEAESVENRKALSTEQEKYQELDKLYHAILKEKEQLEKKLEEKEKEIVNLNMKASSKSSEKMLKDQTAQVKQLLVENGKLEREIARFKSGNEKLNNIIKGLKTDLREQKTKLTDQMLATSSDLEKSREQCAWLQGQVDNFKIQLMEAHEKIKVQEKDRAVLAHKVITADEERRTLDRNIKEIRNMMEADKLYQKALSERNEVLEKEVTLLRSEKVTTEGNTDASPQQQGVSGSRKNKDGGDGSGEKKHNSSVNPTYTSAKAKASAVNASSNKGRIRNRQGPPKLRTPLTDRRCHACCERHTEPSLPQHKFCYVEQRHAAARRLCHALSHSPQRKLRGHSSNPAASAPLQDSTPNRHCQHTASCSQSSQHLSKKSTKPSLLCTSEIPSPMPEISPQDPGTVHKRYRLHSHHSRRPLTEMPARATISLHNNPGTVCHRTR